jgi:hypothetical protein
MVFLRARLMTLLAGTTQLSCQPKDNYKVLFLFTIFWARGAGEQVHPAGISCAGNSFRLVLRPC